MLSLHIFLLNVRRALSRLLGIQIFGPIYAGNLKGYRFLVDTYNEYFDSSYDEKSFKYVLNELKQKPGSIIYDMGANIGYFSVLCSAVSGSRASLYAFEPIPANMDILCRHILMNKVKNVFPVNLAVSDQFGMIDFSAENSSVSYTYKQSSEVYGNRVVNIKVGIISLDILIANFGFLPPDILKVDVEGAEYDVLKGGTVTIKKYRPRILLSTHEPHCKGVEKCCLDFLNEMNYDCVQIPNEPGRMVGLNDYWCTPK